MKDKESIEKVKWNIEQWKTVSKRGELEKYKLIEEDIEIMELAVNIIVNQKAEIENQDNNIDTLVKEQDEREKYIYNLEEKIELKQVRIKNLENENDYLKALVKKKDLEITSLKMEHNYDVKMIDEVKGKAVKLYEEIEELKAKLEYKQYNDLDNMEFEKYIEKIVKERTEKLYKEIETLKRLEQEDIRKDIIIDKLASFIFNEHYKMTYVDEEQFKKRKQEIIENTLKIK